MSMVTAITLIVLMVISLLISIFVVTPFDYTFERKEMRSKWIGSILFGFVIFVLSLFAIGIFSKVFGTNEFYEKYKRIELSAGYYSGNFKDNNKIKIIKVNEDHSFNIDELSTDDLTIIIGSEDQIFYEIYEVRYFRYYLYNKTLRTIGLDFVDTLLFDKMNDKVYEFPVGYEMVVPKSKIDQIL